MSRLSIRIFGDPVLREHADPVTEFDQRLRQLADDMLETMRAAGGVGLAANQVGVCKRLVTWALPDEERQGALINPQVIEASEETVADEEGCLSFPGLFYPTQRPLRVRMAARDVAGDELTIDGEGLLARILLHELDHLNGILLIDHLARHDRKDAMRRIRAGELERPPEAAEREGGTDGEPDGGRRAGLAPETIAARQQAALGEQRAGSPPA
jgi:peptide deformylase